MDRADVVVVGAGIIGSTIAWKLAGAGYQVILLDRGQPGGEASSAAGNALIPEAGSAPTELVHFWVESLTRYDRFIAEVREASGAAVEYRVGGRLVLALDPTSASELPRRAEVQAELGVQCELLTREDALRLEPAITPETHAAIYFSQHAVVDNAQLSPAVTLAAAHAGVTLRPYEQVLEIALTGQRVAGVVTTRGKIRADIVVNAAGCWASALTPWRSGIIGPAKGEELSMRAWPPPCRTMVSGPTATVVPRADGRVLAGSTRIDGLSDKDVAASAVARILGGAFQVVPALGEAKFVAAWAGLRPRSRDDLPVIGPDWIDGFYWATGHLSMGILSAPITGDIIGSLLVGRPTPVPIESFSPKRFD